MQLLASYILPVVKKAVLFAKRSEGLSYFMELQKHVNNFNRKKLVVNKKKIIKEVILKNITKVKKKEGLTGAKNPNELIKQANKQTVVCML